MFHNGDEPIPGYQLQARLGSGSLGEVWRASTPGGTTAALKFVPLAGRQGFKELRALRQVKHIVHPHLMPVLGIWILDQHNQLMQDEGLVGLDDSVRGPQSLAATRDDSAPTPRMIVLAMLLGERSLHDRLNDCRDDGLPGIPPQELIGYMQEAAKGIDFLNSARHDLGTGPVAIQHCDIKPHNMLLSGDSVQICDFGLARVLEDSRMTQALSGSPAYMAPECIRGMPSSATDQYSLAVSYYELRTGLLPFSAEDQTTQIRVLRAHEEGKLDLSGLPPAEHAVIKRATAVAPEDRFPSAVEMTKQLESALAAGGFAESRAHLAETDDAFHNPEAAGEIWESHRGTLELPAHAPGLGKPPRPASKIKPPDAAGDRPIEPRPRPLAKLAAIALLLAVVGGIGAFVWHWSTGATADNGDTAKPIVQTIRFFPADAEITIDGARQKPDRSGRLELQLPGDAPVRIYASHADQFERFERELTPQDLKRLDYEIHLERTAKFYADEANVLAGRGQFDAAVESHVQAIEKDAQLGRPLPPIVLGGSDKSVYRLAQSPDGRWLAAAGDEPTVRLWDVSEENPDSQAIELRRHEATIEALAFGPSGVQLVTGSWDGTGVLWDIGGTSPQDVVLAGHDDDVTHAAFSPDGRWLVTGAADGGVIRWDLADNDFANHPVRLTHHQEAIADLAIGERNQLVTGSWDRSIVAWRLDERDPAQTALPIGSHQSELASLAILPPRYVATGWEDGAVLLFPLSGEGGPIRLDKHKASVDAIAVSMNDRWFATGDGNGIVCLWSPDSGGFAPRVLAGHTAVISELQFSPDDRWLLSASWDKTVRLWDLTDPSLAPVVFELPAAVRTAVLGKRWLAVGCEDGGVYLWDFRRQAVIDRARRLAKASGVTASAPPPRRR